MLSTLKLIIGRKEKQWAKNQNWTKKNLISSIRFGAYRFYTFYYSQQPFNVVIYSQPTIPTNQSFPSQPYTTIPKCKKSQ